MRDFTQYALVDFLMERYGLTRPSRDAVSGIYMRNRININSGGERLITDFDFNGIVREFPS